MSALKAFNFDALKSFDRLKSSGIEESQARAFISLVQESANSSFEHLASKEDLALTESRLENKITEVKSELKQDIAEVRTELKQELAKVRGELKQDIAGINGSIAGINGSIAGLKDSIDLLTKLFFGSVLLIMVDIAVTLLHHT